MGAIASGIWREIEMTRVETGSRLHFGPAAAARRQVGRRGVRRAGGLMVEAPAVRVAVEPAADWSATGSAADRAPKPFARPRCPGSAASGWSSKPARRNTFGPRGRHAA